MTRPRAADDFAMIRARMEELHRERAPVPAEPLARPEPPRVSQAERAGDTHRAVACSDNVGQPTLPGLTRETQTLAPLIASGAIGRRKPPPAAGIR
jgi:hypothetical protein